MTHRRGTLGAATCAAAALLALMNGRSVTARVEGASACNLTTTDRIVAVGDIHGAYEPFVKILQSAGVIDARQRWIAGGTVLVQTGDVVDRGSDSRRVLDLLRRLEGEAERAGGRVLPLVGNHEVMAMLGDLRYVSAADYETFRTAGSEELRERVSVAVMTRAESAARTASERFDRDGFRERFLSATPLGSVERQLAFGPDGEYGRWLRTRNTVVKINGVLFVHGGISPATAALGCDGINDTVRNELKEPPVDAARLSAFLSTREDGPLWYRGLAVETDAAPVTSMLAQLQARIIVIGHTISSTGRIATRFDGRVVQIDTGMLGGTFYPGGRPSALEIQDGRFVAIYEDGREQLPIRQITRNETPSSAR
jgi:hypothetical protein